MIDPMNLLVLEATFCTFCFRAGKRPPAHEAGILGGVRFGRGGRVGNFDRSYRRATRRRVIRHVRAEHPEFKAPLKGEKV